jgi:hypothetical protein
MFGYLFKRARQGSKEKLKKKLKVLVWSVSNFYIVFKGSPSLLLAFWNVMEKKCRPSR